MSKAAVSCQDLQKHYEMGEVIVKALRGATFDVPEGSLVLLLGP